MRFKAGWDGWDEDGEEDHGKLQSPAQSRGLLGAGFDCCQPMKASTLSLVMANIVIIGYPPNLSEPD